MAESTSILADILIWGHRGHRHHRVPYKYPGAPFENSMAAYAFTLRHADGIECDVVRSGDETVYLAHDTDNLPDGTVIYEMEKNLDSRSVALMGPRKIYEMPDADIAALRLRDGQALARLDEVLAALQGFPQATLVIELKGPYTNDAALRSVERAIAQGLVTPAQIIFSSFNFPALAALRRQVNGRFKIAAIFDADYYTPTPMYPDWDNAPIDACYVPFRPDGGVLDLPDIVAMRPDYFHLEVCSLNAGAIAAIGEKYPAAKISLWTIGEAHPDDGSVLVAMVETFAGSGKLHAVITDFPEAIKERLSSAFNNGHN